MNRRSFRRITESLNYVYGSVMKNCDKIIVLRRDFKRLDQRLTTLEDRVEALKRQ